MKKKALNEKAYSLIGVDGNAFAVMGYVSKAMRECGHSRDEINAYLDDAKSSDYNYLLNVSMDMIEMLNDENGYKGGHQFTKPSYPDWEEAGPEEEVYEGYGFPEYDDIELDDDDIYGDQIHVTDHLFPMRKNQQCLYMTRDDLESEGVNANQMGKILRKFPFESCICNGAIEVLFTQDQYFQFYKKFDLELKSNLALDINDLRPYVLSYDEMQPIINDSFKNKFRR